MNSDALFQQAKLVMSGGVSASMRLHPYLKRPIYLKSGQGPWIQDHTGKWYIDFNLSNGAALLGHSHPEVNHAVSDMIGQGYVSTSETELHVELAGQLVEMIPCAEQVRFSTTGSEATALAIRLARHVTGQDKILKFNGHFHGMSDDFLFAQAETVLRNSEPIPTSAGVPVSRGADSVIAEWNNPESFIAALDEHSDEIAAIIAEPVWYNAGCIPPDEGFLGLIREEATNRGIVLIFDEVLSGFRMDPGGAQAWYGVTPDLCTLAKAVANGMPLSVIAGRGDMMDQIAPSGPVAHSGTYSGHILSVAAALATLEILREPGRFEALRETTEDFYRSLREIFTQHGLPVQVQGLGARFGLYFGLTDSVRNHRDAYQYDRELHERFVLGCLERGVHFHAWGNPNHPGHAGISFAHDEETLASALSTIDDVAATLGS